MHRGIALKADELRHLNRSGSANPADVIAQQIHDHHVFSPVLVAANQLSRQLGVLVRINVAWACALDRSCLHAPRGIHLEKALGGAGQQGFIVVAEDESGKGCGAVATELDVQLQCRGLRGPGGAAAGGEIGLEQITGGNQIPDSLHPRCKVVTVGVLPPVSQGQGWSRCRSRRSLPQRIFQLIDSAAFTGFSPEFASLQIEPQQRVMPGDPEACHRIG